MSTSSDDTRSYPPADPSAAGPELPPHLTAKLKLDVPGYQLLDEIDSGGQATVYRAREQTSGLTVAVKLLHGGQHADSVARERFRRETAALKRLNHPNIVFAIDSGRTPAGLDYLVMSYVDGRPLDALWTDRAFATTLAAKFGDDASSRLRLFRQICEVVQAAHREGITHRDLSPSNILIDTAGEPHVLDFGLASTAFDAAHGSEGKVTVTGQFLGKLKYASPEQARGGRDPLRPPSDVYSLGVMLYQILTNGAFPYEVVGNVVDVLNNIIHSAPTRPSDIVAARQEPTRSITPGKARPVRSNPQLVNATIEAIVLKALEKDPGRRYADAGELGQDVSAYLAGEPTKARTSRPAASVSAAATGRRNGVWPTVLTAGVTAALIVAASNLAPWRSTPTPAPPASSPAAPPRLVSAEPVPAEPGEKSAEQVEAEGIARLEKTLVSSQWTYYDSLYPPGGPIEFFGNHKFSKRWHWNYWVVGPKTMHVQYWDPDYAPSKSVVFTFNDDLTAATCDFPDSRDSRIHRVALTRTTDSP